MTNELSFIGIFFFLLLVLLFLYAYIFRQEREGEEDRGFAPAADEEEAPTIVETGQDQPWEEPPDGVIGDEQDQLSGPAGGDESIFLGEDRDWGNS